MASKWFFPKKEDLKYVVIVGQFPCQTEDCEAVEDMAKHFQSIDRLAWQCEYGHTSNVKASDYV